MDYSHPYKSPLGAVFDVVSERLTCDTELNYFHITFSGHVVWVFSR
jgi:hypothetical protein